MNDPCTSRAGQQKLRWPNELAAWFVCERDERRGTARYAYWCTQCKGWHTATARTSSHRRVAASGVAWVRKQMGLRPPAAS